MRMLMLRKFQPDSMENTRHKKGISLPAKANDPQKLMQKYVENGRVRSGP